jgi:hypothetical protein
MLAINLPPLSVPAEIRAVSQINGKGHVLAHLTTNKVTPWVTWAFDDGGYYWGHYFRDHDEALADYRKRTA